MSLTRIKNTGEHQGIPASDEWLTISVPIQIKRRSALTEKKSMTWLHEKTIAVLSSRCWYLWVLALCGFVTSFGAHIIATNLPAYAQLVGSAPS
jgi:hypothetical protein